VEAALHFRVYQWGPQFCHQWELSKNGGRGKETIGNQPKIAGHLVNRRVPVKLASMDSIANGPAVVALLVITVGVPMVAPPTKEAAATTAGIGGLFVSSVSTQDRERLQTGSGSFRRGPTQGRQCRHVAVGFSCCPLDSIPQKWTIAVTIDLHSFEFFLNPIETTMNPSPSTNPPLRRDFGVTPNSASY
jgi:hypothetical protein